jgi:hypothetical protein
MTHLIYVLGPCIAMGYYKYHSFVKCFKRQWNELRFGHLHYILIISVSFCSRTRLSNSRPLNLVRLVLRD